jgi:hydrogenase maturation protease
VLGLGNLLWADEGFGVRCIEVLQEQYDCPADVHIVDGGTQGLYLLPLVQSASKLLIFDAIDYQLEPGTLHTVRGEDVPRFLGVKKLSLHQTGFQEVLALAELCGQLPADITLIGCQPERLDDYGGSLRPKLRAALAEAVVRGVEQLRAWEVGLVRRSRPSPVETACLSLARYEAERPSEQTACRIGDARFLPVMEED